MVVVPVVKPVATPLVLMEATAGLLLLQTRPSVGARLLTEPSEKYPVAAKDSFQPVPMVETAGLIMSPYFPNKLHKQELVTYNKAA
jgi:hypothetical protein